MKKHLTYSILLSALLLSGNLSAKVNHYVGAFANLGEWSLLTQDSKYATSFGVAGGLGFQYELKAGPKYGQTHFLFDAGVGLLGGTTSFFQGSNFDITLDGQTDLNGLTFNYVYEIQDRKDSYRNLAVQVPIMVGMQHRRFYFLAGIKVGTNLFTRTHSSGLLTTYGQYEGLDDFHNMPEYQFFDGLSVTGGVKTHLNIDLDASLEIGGRIGGVVTNAVGYDVPKNKIEYRLAAFIDYGLMDLHVADTQEALIAPTGYNTGETTPVYNTRSMVDGLVMNDIMSTEGFAKSVSNFMIGLKFTVLFQVPEAGQCILCRDSYRSLARPGRGGVKYDE